MKSTRNDRRPDASIGDINSNGDSPDRGSGGHVNAANLIMSPTSWGKRRQKDRQDRQEATNQSTTAVESQDEGQGPQRRHSGEE